MKIKSVEFVKSAVHPRDFPDEEIPEIAFAGRSNVGKSSLINTICNRKRLVRVSNTPGRTQLVNFFRVNDELSLVDLPGYGYAKVPKKERFSWGTMIENYFEHREQLQAVVVICDFRRGIQESDWMLIEAAPLYGWQPLIVFTKDDKFKSNAKRNRRRELAVELGVEPEDVLLFSSLKKTGVEEMWDVIKQITGIDSETPED